ncbi:Dynein light chain 1, cytoplasmic [Echinococcus granulosus]|uniref:Dynein light chain n=3 Tax=Taeniidae TaxID=6208 RepID=U6JHL4_ECHGR|nr:Dynein light chain 1, cytoplasmic [Echinococcus granulosus]EUB59667.1 Dynein light chain 1, cytoplasmic [Echinococcus granulosus]KAH9280328.1 Dynein light chain 1, cytoplasmic [Echinococcus granulosus]CDI96978.1 dynein light chain [Echinococcus multilocularis]CDS21953.1 dynein light chain [Echinococcus granulosus]|eukprot:TsM_000669000 transcript=TsM_000669000 gene=TsM_000669000
MPHAKAYVKQADMLDQMQQEAVNHAYEALHCNTQYMDIAKHLRTHFDHCYGPSWSCVVGKDFGTSFAYEKKHLISFELKGYTFLLFRGA